MKKSQYLCQRHFTVPGPRRFYDDVISLILLRKSGTGLNPFQNIPELNMIHSRTAVSTSSQNSP